MSEPSPDARSSDVPDEAAEAAPPGAGAAASTDRRAEDADPAAEPPSAERAARPEQTRDDTDVGWGQTPEPADAHDQWLLEQRPPHWD
jgi:hypothetical protein